MPMYYKYWNECVESEDMKLMWDDSDVSKEWTDAGERFGQKVHLSRDPDGQTYLTQTEMRAVARIVVDRHFKSQIDPDVLCALAEILSDRQLLGESYDKKLKETKIGIMQIALSTAEWLVRDMGYRKYELEDESLLYRPFVNVYFGAAYVKWLFNHDGKQRSEEYVVRAYKGGLNKATHKSTETYFERYFSFKRSLPPKRRRKFNGHTLTPDFLSIDAPAEEKEVDGRAYWDLTVSEKDMDEMWKNPDVNKEWTKSGERRRRVRFSQDSDGRSYISRVEVKAVAEIIVSRYFKERLQPTTLAAVAEIRSLRFVNGLGSHTGLMGIDYPTAFWMYRDLGFRSYEVNSVEDLYNPFVSIYFGAAYYTWLSKFEGRERSQEFVVQAYMGGPENVNLQETGPFWKKFQEALRYYEVPKKERRGCCIL
ncbi:hypothetical protein KFK09_021900 [Dendrobium nobile]|uniref:Transglycosylase SLT domain-containing protein n=1 Tax=Dendrobium nobile TaxID=94219 RepID=A0A8T3AHF5_DENNO|nr:hypothetical protein KFK09_021900 [Dendrobium nobile]